MRGMICRPTPIPKTRNLEMSTKTRNSRQNRPGQGQKHVRKRGKGRRDALGIDGLKNNLGHLVGSLSTGDSGNVQAYEQIAARMSELVGLNGNAWTWRYVASVHSGSLEPGKKFLRVLELLLEEFSPRKKQWFYFARYHSLAAIYDKCVKREMILEHMRALGYKAVSFSRYMEIKRAAIHKKTR